MTRWGDGTRCYPTRIVGDARSAMVIFVGSLEMFGREVRVVGVSGRAVVRVGFLV